MKTDMKINRNLRPRLGLCLVAAAVLAAAGCGAHDTPPAPAPAPPVAGQTGTPQAMPGMTPREQTQINGTPPAAKH